jgi:hypothetical protein
MSTMDWFDGLAKTKGKRPGAWRAEQKKIAKQAGFEDWAALVAASEDERRLAKVMLIHPELHAWGRGQHPGSRKRSPEERQADMGEARKALRDSVAAVAWVADWIADSMAIVKALNKRHSSYGLKHLAERHRGEYVSNGAFIAGAILVGLKYSNDYSPCFNISEDSIQRLRASCPGMAA